LVDPPAKGGDHGTYMNVASHLAMGYIFTGDTEYANASKHILKVYADNYNSYSKLTHSDGMWTTQSLNDSSYIIHFINAYDLIYNSGVLSNEEKEHIEDNLFRAAA